MLKIIIQTILGAYLLLTVACIKDLTTPVTNVGDDFFVEGRGLRKIWSIESPVSGLGNYSINAFTATPDGFINTVFNYTRSGVNGGLNDEFYYRKKININNGDTVSTLGIPTSVPPITTVGCISTGVVPYTDQFVYLYNGNILGNPNWAPMPYNNDFAKIYSTRQAVCYSSYFNVFTSLPNVGAIYFTNNSTSTYEAKVLGQKTLCTSVEMAPSGQVLAFVMQKTDSLQVYDFSTRTLLASLYLPQFFGCIPANYPADYRPNATLFTKRSQDGTKIIGLVTGMCDLNSTFVYDIASSTLTPKVQNASLDYPFQMQYNSDFDEEGNIYYIPRFSGIELRKISPASGDVVYKSNFVTGSGGVIGVSAVGNKLFVTCAKAGNNTYSDSRGKGAMLITVVE